MTVKTMYSVYGFTENECKKQQKTSTGSIFDIQRPVGMNNLIALGQRTKYTLNQLAKLNAMAKARGFLILVAYADDTVYSIYRVD